MVSVLILGIFVMQVFWVMLYIFTDFDMAFADLLVATIRGNGSPQELVVKVPVVLFTLYFAIYLFIKRDYGEKWRYCAAAYNSLFLNSKIKPPLNKRAALAIDVLYLDLWAKRGFCKFFHDTLFEIVNERNDWNSEQKDSFRKKVEEHCLNVSDAEEILEYGMSL